MFEDEHHGPSAAESYPELAFRVHWVGLGLIAAIGAGGNAPIIEGVVAVLSLIGVALLFANRESYPGSLLALTGRYLLWMLPAWLVIGCLIAGHFYPAYHTTSDGTTKSWELLPLPSEWMPVGGPLKTSGLAALLAAGIFATCLNALLMCKSRLVFARTWAALSLGAGGLALLGLVQFASGADKMLWAIPTGNPKFFASFPHPAQWCAFALLWLGAALGLIAWLVRQRGWRWASGEGSLFLIAAILLGVSIEVVGDPGYRVLAAVLGGLGCFSIAWQARQERRQRDHSGLSLNLFGWMLAGLILCGLAAQIALRHPLDEWIQYANGGVVMHERVLEDTRAMWQARPWFGWGPASYRVVYGFFQGADQGGQYYAYARSDFWQSLAEHGMIGTVIWWVPAMFALIRLVWQRRLASFLIAPLVALVALTALTFVDFPLASPAVFFGYWLILFSISRWTEVDRENTPSNPSERRRIKQLRAAGQTLPGAPTPAAPK